MQSTQQTSTKPRGLEAAAYAGMFVFGMVMAMLGAILPLIASRLRIDLAQAGGLFGVLGAAMLVSGFAAGPLMDRYGKKIPMVAGPLVTAAAVAMMAGASTWSVLTFAVALLGLGGGAINNVANAVVSDLYEDPRRKGSALNLLGSMFGIGALALPFSIGRLVATVGLPAILYAAALMSAAAAIVSAVARYPRPTHGEGFSVAEAARLLRNPDVLALGTSLFCQSGNEFVLSGFIATFVTSVLGGSVQTASYVLALYWATILLARIAMSRILLRVPAIYVLIVAALGSAAGVAVLAGARSIGGAIAGTVVLGAFISCIFTTTLGVAGARFRSYLGTVFGILFGMSLAGGMSLPVLFGRFAQNAGLRTALLQPIIVFGIIAAIHALYTARRISAGPRG